MTVLTNHSNTKRRRDRQAELRFSIIGHLLASPPKNGEVRATLKCLAAMTWRHPVTEEPVRFGLSTLERWYYAARAAKVDPVGALRRRIRSDAGRRNAVCAALGAALFGQYESHKSWSVKLHADNLRVLVKENPSLGPMPSYSTIRRFMKSNGLSRVKQRKNRSTAGAILAAERLDRLEVRSYEAEHVGALWHADFHKGSRQIISVGGEWLTPILFGSLDDRSRLACHVQWYLGETAEIFVHGLSQAIQKRGLPRSFMTDRGAAMRADEVREGLLRLGILHTPTLPYSPYQNAKMEIFWASVEGRLIAMLEGVEHPTLELLNQATQAWVELEYNRQIHSETGASPVARFLEGPDVSRPSPSSIDLRRAFRTEVRRTQRRSDGTLTVDGVRFEVPGRYRHLNRLLVRYASWDLSSIDLVDEGEGRTIAELRPLNRAHNANGVRRTLEPIAGATTTEPAKASGGMAPLLRQLMTSYVQNGIAAAYIPFFDTRKLKTENESNNETGDTTS